MLVVQPIGGLANRMRVLDSAMALAAETDQALWVLWTQDRDLNCRLDDLFVVPECVRWLHHINMTGIPGKVLYRVYRFVLNRLCDLQLTDRTLEPIFANGGDLAAMVRGRRAAVFGCKRFYESTPRFGLFVPVPSLQAEIDAFSDRATAAVGVHVRRGDSDWPIRHSPTAEFIRLMEAEVRADPDTTFLVASDSPEEEERLRGAFPGRVHTRPKRSYARDDPGGIQDGLVDLYCLSKSRKLLGSFGSSFTEAASQIGGMATRRARVLPSMVAEFAGLTNVDALPDEAACFETIRRTRWARVVFCPECGGDEVVPRGPDHSHPHLHTYLCRNCVRLFNDLTGTVLAGRVGVIRPWLVCLCYVNQGLPTETIARHLHLTVDEVSRMRTLLGQRPQADSEGTDVDDA